MDIPDATLQQSGQLAAYFVAELKGRMDTLLAWPLTVLHGWSLWTIWLRRRSKTWKELDQRLRPLEKSGIGDLTSKDKGKLLYVSADGVLVPSNLGSGLAIVNGVLTLTNADTRETVEINARIVGGGRSQRHC